jgi:hypothetical protein
MMTDLTPLLFEPDTTIALVGATDNPSKYGSVIYRDLTAKRLTVFPINPSRDTVGGEKAYPDLASLPHPPTIINLVIPPERGLAVVDEVIELGYDNVWLQPGADSPELLAKLEAAGLRYVADSCIMVRARFSGV